MEGFGGSDTAREAEDGKRGGGRKLPASCLKGTQLPDFKDRKKPRKTGPSAEIVECEIGKFGGHENRRSIAKATAPPGPPFARQCCQGLLVDVEANVHVQTGKSRATFHDKVVCRLLILTNGVGSPRTINYETCRLHSYAEVKLRFHNIANCYSRNRLCRITKTLTALPLQGWEKNRSLAPSFDRAQQNHASRNRPSSRVKTNFAACQCGPGDLDPGC